MDTHKTFSSFSMIKLNSPLGSYTGMKRHELTSKSIQTSPTVSDPVHKKLKSCSSMSLKSKKQTFQDKQLQVFKKVYPQWLLERNDFRYVLYSEEEQDIAKICAKPYDHRNSRENRQVLAWCRACPFFRSFSEFTCTEVSLKLITQEFDPNDIIITEGDLGYSMFAILKGRVKVFKNNAKDCIDILGPYNIFGDLSLESNNTRSATIVAYGCVTVLKLEKEDYINILMRQKHRQRSGIVLLLKKTKFFEDLTSVRLQMVAWKMLVMQYDPEQIIYDHFHTANGIFFLKEGHVRILTDVVVVNKNNLPTSYRGRETLVRKKTYEILFRNALPGDFFGEERIRDSAQTRTRAVCIQRSEIVLLTKECLFDLFNENEIKQIFGVNEKSANIRQLRKDFVWSLKNKDNKYKAFLDAINIVPLPIGRETTRNPSKKSSMAKEMVLKHTTDLNHNLLKEECYIKTQKIIKPCN